MSLDIPLPSRSPCTLKKNRLKHGRYRRRKVKAKFVEMRGAPTDNVNLFQTRNSHSPVNRLRGHCLHIPWRLVLLHPFSQAFNLLRSFTIHVHFPTSPVPTLHFSPDSYSVIHSGTYSFPHTFSFHSHSLARIYPFAHSPVKLFFSRSFFVLYTFLHTLTSTHTSTFLFLPLYYFPPLFPFYLPPSVYFTL